MRSPPVTRVKAAQVRRKATRGTPIPRLWRVSTLARHLNVSRQWIYRWIKQGRLPSYRLYGAVLLREVDIVRLLREQGVPLEEACRQRNQS